MPGNVQIRSTSVPVGFCFTTFEESWPTLVGLLYGNADVSPNVSAGDAAPTDLTKIWFRTISGVPDRFYYYASGVWVAKHALPTGVTVLAPAGTALADIDTLDGGEVGAVTAFTGPMWAVDDDFAERFPIGPGTLPSGTVINEGDTGGEEKVSLKLEEMPPHHHVLLVSQSNTGGGSDVQRLRPNATEADSNASSANEGGDADGVVVAHNNMSPWRARFFIKRTGRTHYRA